MKTIFVTIWVVVFVVLFINRTTANSNQQWQSENFCYWNGVMDKINSLPLESANTAKVISHASESAPFGICNHYTVIWR
jgi:hypothetical protein